MNTAMLATEDEDTVSHMQKWLIWQASLSSGSMGSMSDSAECIFPGNNLSAFHPVCRHLAECV